MAVSGRDTVKLTPGSEKIVYRGDETYADSRGSEELGHVAKVGQPLAVEIARLIDQDNRRSFVFRAAPLRIEIGRTSLEIAIKSFRRA